MTCKDILMGRFMHEIGMRNWFSMSSCVQLVKVYIVVVILLKNVELIV